MISFGLHAVRGVRRPCWLRLGPVTSGSALLARSRTARNRPSFHVRCAAALLFITGCASNQFDVRSEPSFAHAHHRFSTFAVQRDGLLSREGWQVLGPNMPAPFGAQHCEVAFGQAMFASSPALADAIGSYVRSNGVTDALLERLAPAAEGDAIVFVTLSGAPRVASDGGPNTVAMASGRGGRRGGMGGARGGVKPGGLEPRELGDGFQIDASFYSVRERRSLAEIRLNYKGTRIDEAVREFNDRLDREFPGASCGGWNWSAQLDPATIRQLPEQ
jgi:hypothetical protein